MDNQKIISVSELSFSYGHNNALKNVSFSTDRSELTALVGPNGAGKSTLMKCLAGLIFGNSGTVKIDGTDINSNTREAHTKIGYLSDDFGLYNDLKIIEILEYFADCHLISENERLSRIEEVSKLLRISHKLGDKASSLSRGWRQRVGMAIAIIHNPKILILDEPASGLDPESRSELSEILTKLHLAGTHILVSSHILSELEDYCNSMLVLRDGEIKEHISLNQSSLDKEVSAVMSFARELLETELELITKILGNSFILSENKQELACKIENNSFKQHDLLKSLINISIPIYSFRLENSSLEKIYLEIAKKLK